MSLALHVQVSWFITVANTPFWEDMPRSFLLPSRPMSTIMSTLFMQHDEEPTPFFMLMENCSLHEHRLSTHRLQRHSSHQIMQYQRAETNHDRWCSYLNK